MKYSKYADGARYITSHIEKNSYCTRCNNYFDLYEEFYNKNGQAIGISECPNCGRRFIYNVADNTHSKLGRLL
jgi:predicted RNA-binding Zn-ribbon protein involved in translation (DUF1610 family)